jgi:glutamine amidotransferase-like uncharacterized protein
VFSRRFHKRALAMDLTVAFAAFFTVAIASMGCGSGGTRSVALAPTPAPLPPAVKAAEPVLLYVGVGTSASDVAAVKAVLKGLNIGYLTADENQLNAMAEPVLGGYKMFLVPGGNSITIGQSLSANTTATIRNAIAQYGVHYMGICAGAFFGGYSIYNGLDLTSGVYFDFYQAEFQGIHLAAVEISPASGSPLEVYWNDGPQMSGWGDVVAKYPDGTPAIVEGTWGNGFVVLAGVHLEAPASWRVAGMNYTAPADIAYAGTMIQAALNGTPLPHF